MTKQIKTKEETKKFLEKVGFEFSPKMSEEEKAHYAHWKANHAIGTTYKKAVNTLKRSIKR